MECEWKFHIEGFSLYYTTSCHSTFNWKSIDKTKVFNCPECGKKIVFKDK